MHNYDINSIISASKCFFTWSIYKFCAQLLVLTVVESGYLITQLINLLNVLISIIFYWYNCDVDIRHRNRAKGFAREMVWVWLGKKKKNEIILFVRRTVGVYHSDGDGGEGMHVYIYYTI